MACKEDNRADLRWPPSCLSPRSARVLYASLPPLPFLLPGWQVLRLEGRTVPFIGSPS